MKAKQILSLFLLLFIVISLFITPKTYAAGTGVDDLYGNGLGENIDTKINIPGITTTTSDGHTQTDFWISFLDKYKGAIIGVSGMCALTFLIFFIVNFVKLGQSSDNPQMRSQALMGIVWCGIACAATGGISIFFGFFYNALKNPR